MGAMDTLIVRINVNTPETGDNTANFEIPIDEAATDEECREFALSGIPFGLFLGGVYARSNNPQVRAIYRRPGTIPDRQIPLQG